ncbi:hypothetical protein QJS10_CPB17g01202 [Acorus calamus]|uniref:Uncharacterized protein n=1 Tax=Acorus calamus TaxID=4465 RepID=A0AAV9CX41_ACOCL|nr:hypothetical protein QJS10_CPB17g01202 [Acorus calamus]
MKISSTYYFTELSTWSLSTLSTPPTTTTTTQKTSHPTTTTTHSMHTTFKFLKMVFSKTSKNKISSSMIDFFNKAKVSLRLISSSSSSSSYPASQVADADEEGEIKNIIFVGDAPPRMDEEEIRMTSSEKWIEIEILNHPENNHLRRRRRRLIGWEEELVGGVEKEVEMEEEGLCSKRILMGRRCRPIDFYEEEEEEEKVAPENDMPAFGPTTHNLSSHAASIVTMDN